MFEAAEHLRRLSERVLRRTESSGSPWHIVESSDHRYRDLTVATRCTRRSGTRSRSGCVNSPFVLEKRACPAWRSSKGGTRRARGASEREQTPYKKYKITDKDYRNREHWDQYCSAVNEMVQRTSTDFAPWTLVPSNDKRFARVTVLSTICDDLAKHLREA